MAELDIAVVIPTLNEQDQLARTLTLLAEQLGRPTGLSGGLPGTGVFPGGQVIVADGGSTDQTCQIARAYGAQVVVSARGRGTQMNAGAAVASAAILLFLHADTQLESGWPDAVRQAVAESGVVGGAFSLRIDAPGKRYRNIEKFVAWRSRRLQLPYGDQGLFLRKDIFNAVGGYAPMEIMEDYDLVRRLKKHGILRLLPQVALTSARRWRVCGIGWASIINLSCVLAYHCCLRSSWIAKWRRVTCRQVRAS